MRRARLINGYPWEGPGQYTIVDSAHGETISEWFDDEIEFEEFVGDFDDDDPHSEWEVYYDGESAYASRRAMRNKRLSMRKRASDGWDNEICEDLVACLELCSELEYEIKHCARGAYCREAGETYESLGTYALALGKSLRDAGEALCDEYGDLTSEEIDEMVDSSYSCSIW